MGALEPEGRTPAYQAAPDVEGPRGLEAAASGSRGGRDLAREEESRVLVCGGRRRPREERPGTVAGQGRAPAGR